MPQIALRHDLADAAKADIIIISAIRLFVLSMLEGKPTAEDRAAMQRIIGRIDDELTRLQDDPRAGTFNTSSLN